jgi:hypothetical protein
MEDREPLRRLEQASPLFAGTYQVHVKGGVLATPLEAPVSKYVHWKRPLTGTETTSESLAGPSIS